jgi:hypothetical protein
VAREFIESPEERARREELGLRRALLADDSIQAIKTVVGQSFDSQHTVTRLNKFAHLAKAWSLYKRLTKERTRPVYSVPPTRHLLMPEGTDPEVHAAAQVSYRDLCKEAELDARMRAACFFAVGANHAFLYTRYVKSLDRVVIDVIHADNMWIIPHPDAPLEAIAYIYGKPVWHDGKWCTWFVYWDSQCTFQMDEQFHLRPFTAAEKNTPVRLHEMAAMPFVPLHAYDRTGHYWNVTEGSDAVAADLSTKLMGLLGLRNLKTRGFRQLFVEGGGQGLPKGQTLDEESVFVLEGESRLSSLDTQSDSSHYLAMLDAVKLDASANAGVSRARLNQDRTGADSSDDTGLHEQRGEIAQVMYAAEMAQFEVMRMVSREAGRPIPDEAILENDFGEIEFRADPEGTLNIWEKLRGMGAMNTLDILKRINPEIRTDDEAWREFERNLAVEARRIEMQRALQMSPTMTMEAPGQNAQANGALGPQVRDGQMTGDEAAKKAEGGTQNYGEGEE